MSFKRLYEKNRQTAINCILDGSLRSEDIEEIYDIIKEQKDDELFYAFYEFLRKNQDNINYDKLEEATGIPRSILEHIFYEKPKIAYFPSISLQDGRLCKAIVFIFDDGINVTSLPRFTTLPHTNSLNYKEGIEAVRKIFKKRYPNKDFFVMFDSNFKGSSFTLALLSALFLKEETLKKFAFTGDVKESEDILKVNYLDQKKKIAQDAQLKLITYEDVSNVEELLYYLGEGPIDIPFININRGLDEALNSLEKLENAMKEQIKFFSLEKLSKFFNIDKEDLILTTESLPPITEEDLSKENPWIKAVLEFESKLKNIYDKVGSRKRVIHFVGSISSLVFGLGVKFGSRKPVVVYHYQADTYNMVLDLSDEDKLRRIKHIKENLELLKLENIKSANQEEVGVVIYFASHSPLGDVLRFSENKNLDIFLIEAKDLKGNIPIPKKNEENFFTLLNLWSEIVREIYSALNMLKDRYKKLHIFLSVPVPIAFCLGMAVGHFMNATIYNYNTKSQDTPYYPVFDTFDERLKSHF
ncbi:MAG TPA: SAVED domain-containing protein [Hydrogenobaculum sp.]|nr:SAVED domain-containing protein [Hydrogenobaculum sp.]